ncbi:MAG TPA: hypothetical protein VFW70_04740 [Methylomirabilota bacterium]|nr:hypothetical protein [Methylomirabilota bacterium]
MESARDRLNDLSRRLLRLHGLLLNRERRAYERRHGALQSRALLDLLLHDEDFAWLRSLSGLVAHIDELVSTDDAPPAEIVERVFAEATRLLKSGEQSPFHEKYRDALQESPDIVMAHAEVSKLLTGR